MAVALDAHAPAPRMVGRYLLYGEIASGGMASVHFGRLVGPMGFARPVAIKRLHAQFARDPDFVTMFLDEARLAARIAHPNVVPTLDVVNVDNEVFIVMEYVRGVTLAHLSRAMRERNERIAPNIALGIVSGMLQGLHAAHEARNDLGERLHLVHRDVSPQNAIVGTDGVTRLLDFGVAKAAGRLQSTRDGQLKGKLAYMAPEQVRGETVDRRTDIYAASVVLWEVLTGKRLFFANNEANVLSNVLSAQVAPPSSIVPGLPPALDRIVLRGLERDPAKRFSTARDMAAEVGACLSTASGTEIGDWVERTAGEELQAHARRVGSIERAAAVSPENLPGLAMAPAGDDAFSPGQRQPSDKPTYAWGERATGTKKPQSARLVYALGALGLAIAVAVSTLALSRSKHDNATVAAPSAHAPATSSAVVATAPTIPSFNVEDLASAAPTAAEPPSPPAAPVIRAPSTGASPPPRAAPSKPGAVDCNPPYTLDAKGHTHFKPNCI